MRFFIPGKDWIYNMHVTKKRLKRFEEAKFTDCVSYVYPLAEELPRWLHTFLRSWGPLDGHAYVFSRLRARQNGPKRFQTPAAAPLFPVGKTSGRGGMHDGASSRPWRYRRAQHETEREGSWIRKSCNN